MLTDPSISQQTYQHFLQESADLLQAMDNELQTLRADFSIQKVHSLMRAAHTLKGASASVGLDAIKKTTHSLEDVFRALCHPDTVLTLTVERLIFEGFDCLSLLMSAQLAGAQVDESDILDRMATVVSQLQANLGDRLGQGGHLPTSSELGFDITRSIFEVGVAQRIAALEAALDPALTAADPAALDPALLRELLQTQSEVFTGLAESLDLPGFGAIAQTTLQALAQNPDRVIEIAPLALADYQAAHAAVLAGDRSQGGAPSAALNQFCRDQNKAQNKAQGKAERSHWSKQLWRTLTQPIGNPSAFEASGLDMGALAMSGVGVRTEDLTEPTFTEPTASEPDESASELPFETAGEPAALPDLVGLVEPGDRAPSTTASQPPGQASIRMSLEHLDQLTQAMGELLTYQNRQALYNEQITPLVQKLLNRITQQQKQLTQLQGQWQGQTLSDHSLAARRAQRPNPASQPANFAYAQFDALELDEYSDVQLLAQSFLEETVQLSESAEAIELFVRRSRQDLEKQKRLLATTRETLLAARMLSIEKVFQRFPAVVERLQAHHNKPVEVTLKGQDILVDKMIADKLYDPLLHLVRNAFDHGIEPAEVRRQQNKPAIGNITIEALQQGRHLVISVQDDGQGLDLEMIRRKAIDSQIITAAAAAALTPTQIVDLLFETGFSTASKVDDLSGRGLGLDVVRTQTRSLQGWSTVSHNPGIGTCFTLQIPASLTIAKLILCQTQGRIYALIADAIKHVLIPTAAQVRTWEGGKMLTWQASGEEHLVPIDALADVLRHASPLPHHRLLETRSNIKTSDARPVILLQHQNALIGLEVDQLLGEQEMVINALGETIVPPPYLYGSSLLPDGQLTLVLDAAMLAKMIVEKRSQGSIEIALEEGGPTRIKPAKDQPIFAKKQILIVDDSITVRNALVDALQKADYQVIQARDGAEALQQLARSSDVQAILCDIEMPGMNGFEFLKARRQQPEIAAIPTVMLTSRAGTKHRLLTEELGATAYLTKPYLTPNLLKTVAEAIARQTHLPLSLAGETYE
ncbi:MAG: hybrid sensor histidine kinase/response regulator [Phormidesmis sp.]